MLDYIRIACAVPEVQVANVEKNTRDICGFMEKADAQNVDVLVFPELAMTGYSCGDLFLEAVNDLGIDRAHIPIVQMNHSISSLTVLIVLAQLV